MRLSEFVDTSKVPAAVGPKVLAVVRPVLAAIGAGEDPSGWLAADEDAADRWDFLAPTPAGLVTCHVRVNVPGEGPRASAKLVRWPRVVIGELAVESGAGGRRLVSFQLDNRAVRAAGTEGDAVAAFAQAVLAAMDGRPMTDGAAGVPAALPALPPHAG
jgi:hypothetical protein